MTRPKEGKNDLNSKRAGRRRKKEKLRGLP
jgi:hypothetical protein